MRSKTLFGQIFPLCLGVSALSLLWVTWHTSGVIRNFYHQEAKSDLKVRARLLGELFAGRFSSDASAEVDALCKQLGSRISMRITVILPSGRVIGDSEENPARMDNHSDRREVVQALRGGAGSATRFSHTLQQEMLYVAVPVSEEGRLVGLIRASVPLASARAALADIYRNMAWVGALAALAAGAISLFVSHRISRPLRELKAAAERFSRGDRGVVFPHHGSEDVAALAKGMNQMVTQLDDRIRAAARQQNEMEKMLAHMAEGVLAIDTEERIIRLNPSAGHLLAADPDKGKGRHVQEVIRNAELLRLVTRALVEPDPVEGEILVHDGEDILIGVRGTRLEDADGKSLGALVVLSDLTRLRRLERIRRDFVANVSHELKTPITSLKGFVETLLGDAAGDTENRERFLHIIARQTDRLQAIVEDLLALSQLEEESEKRTTTPQTALLRPVLEAAIQCCQQAASEKGMRIRLLCPENLQANIHPLQIEEAVLNLLDNAVKYSDAGTEIRLEARREGGEICILVQDQGHGISSEHLPRLFERFYRVDKARSRKLGGTGLGLAIVKHIAQAHGGRVAMESAIGRGSVFFIYLPVSGLSVS